MRTTRATARSVIAVLTLTAAGCSDDVAISSGTDNSAADAQSPMSPSAPGAWSDVPESALTARWDAAAMWTGTEVIVWGGYASEYEVMLDGSFYDPAARSWTPIPPAPVPARGHQASAWVNDRLVVWVDAWSSELMAGAAYHRDERQWSPVSPPPRELGHGAAAVATTDAVFVVATESDSDGSTPLVLSYAPATDTWDLLPPPPPTDQEVSIVSDGQQIYLWGCKTGYGAAYDSDAGDWRVVESPPEGVISCLPPPLFPAPVAAAGDVLTWSWSDDATVPAETSGGRAQATPTPGAGYDVQADTWRPVAPAPVTLPARATAADDNVVVWGGGTFPDPPCNDYEQLETTNDGFVYSIADDRWRRIGAGPLSSRNGHAITWTDHGMFIWGGAATAPKGGCDVFADGAIWQPTQR